MPGLPRGGLCACQYVNHIFRTKLSLKLWELEVKSEAVSPGADGVVCPPSATFDWESNSFFFLVNFGVSCFCFVLVLVFYNMNFLFWGISYLPIIAL